MLEALEFTFDVPWYGNVNSAIGVASPNRGLVRSTLHHFEKKIFNDAPIQS
jgi:hypothetical protein